MLRNIEGILGRWFGIERVPADSKPKFIRGFKVGSVDFTVAELLDALAPADSALGFATGITAGTTQTQGGATALTALKNYISTVANAGDGVRLPTAAAGKQMVVHNAGANALALYPATGAVINGGSANAAITVGVGEYVMLLGLSTTAWLAITPVKNAGSQTITGVKTFSSRPSLPLVGTRIAGVLGYLSGQVVFGGAGANVEQYVHSVTIPADSLIAGDRLRLWGFASAAGVNGADTLTLRAVANLSGTPVEILTSGAVNPTVSDLITYDITMQVRSIGGSASIHCAGSIAIGDDVTIVNTAKTIPTNASLVIGIGAVWSSTNAGNIANIDQSAISINAQ